MASATWRLIRSGYQSGAINMAIDESLLEAVAAGTSPPVLRLYRWQPATLSLGYGQSVVKDIDRDLCQERGVGLVRRSTGGRAVLHAHEATYAVIARTDSGVFGRSVLECYRVIAEVLQQMLIGFGLEARLVPGESRGGRNNPTHAVCFSAPSQYELVVKGCKVIGSSQKRQGQAFLQHGSIPLTLDLDLLAGLLKVAPEGMANLSKVGWLNKWLPSPLTVDALEDALIEAFAARLDIDWLVTSLTDQEQRRAQVFHDGKFAHKTWMDKR